MAGLIDKPECRRLRAEGWTLDRLATRYSVSRPAVCKACKGVVCGVDHSLVGVHAALPKRLAHRDEKRAQARALYEAGHEPKEIAHAIGAGLTTVYVYLDGLREPRAARGRRSIVVPVWVPVPLHRTYRDLGLRVGEEAAASTVRRLKAEAAACR